MYSPCARESKSRYPLPMLDKTLFDAQEFEHALANNEEPLALFRSYLQKANAQLKKRFHEDVPVVELVTARAWLVDQLLQKVWQQYFGELGEAASLVAVGGYGRGELHPYSDVDIMLLIGGEEVEPFKEVIEKFLLFLWDIGLEVGHSVRTISDCIRESEQDITVATNLMESRLLTGSEALYQEMCTSTGPDKLWPGRHFFEAKWQEQIGRHRKFNDTAYNLEPNIKEGPGGLRDIQMIGWVAKRHFGARTLTALVEHNFLTDEEYQALIDGQNFLWKIRFGLHSLANRREDRLLFDHQRTLAEQFGYSDEGPRLAVEKFMKDYYRTVMELDRLNELLLQLFQEEILYANDSGKPTPLNKRFQARKGFIEATNENIFKHYPFALLEIFLILAQHPELKGVRAGTIRLIRHHRHLIDDDFRDDIRCRSLFMEFLRQPQGVTHELRRMNRYGILASYLPSFGHIVGQMQHDLFHVYTVDEHTLFVVRNLRRFTVPEYFHEFPLCSAIIQEIPKPEILFIAGLFHDIAKGRGGDHSELGEKEVIEFCQHHLLSQYDTQLAAWLVRNHLVMSTTAQRKDISDPEIINDFASKVGNQNYLNHIFLLTIADIRATSPTVWNSWKGSLLKELYFSTRRALRRGLANPLDQNELIQETQQSALALIGTDSITEEVENLWQGLGDDYFLRYSADEIAWHTSAILKQATPQQPMVLLRNNPTRGASEIFIYTPVRDHLFTLITTTLDQLGLSIVDARISSSMNGYTLDSYIILEDDGEAIRDENRSIEIKHSLNEALNQKETDPLRVQRRVTRQLKHFPIPTQITFQDDVRNQRTIVEIEASDRPGLLSQIGKALDICNLRLQNAKITTLGERIEDIFFVTDQQDQPLKGEAQQERLRKNIIEMLAQV